MKTLLPAGPPDMVRFGEVEQPRPGQGDALVKVEAFSVNRGETFQLERPRPDWRPGKDIAGTVVHPAADGSGPAAGTRVVGHPPASGWAEYVAVPTDSLAVIPNGLSGTLAAALPLAGITALRLLRVAGSPAGAQILVTGASGGVGHYVVELAAASGADITAVTASAERGRRLVELGAMEIVQDVSETTGPFDIVLESTGGSAFTAALARLRRRGTLIWFGEASRTPVTLDFFDFFTGPESATLRHFHYADFDRPYRDDLAILVRLVETGRLHPEIGRVSDWDDTATVLADLRERRIRGNAVLTLS
jgi:NADPH:quinone reductase